MELFIKSNDCATVCHIYCNGNEITYVLYCQCDCCVGINSVHNLLTSLLTFDHACDSVIATYAAHGDIQN